MTAAVRFARRLLAIVGALGRRGWTLAPARLVVAGGPDTGAGGIPPCVTDNMPVAAATGRLPRGSMHDPQDDVLAWPSMRQEMPAPIMQ